MPAPLRYTAADLARLSDTTLRTVRYYVQEGLVDPPASRGRGAHFGESHLRQLALVRALMDAGLDIAAIRQHAGELQKLLAAQGLAIGDVRAPGPSSIHTLDALAALQATAASRGAPADAADDEDDDPAIDEAAARIPLAPGIALLVGSDVRLPSPRRMVELALYVRRVFKLD